MRLPVQIAPADAPPSQTLMWRGCVAWALMGESLELARQITSYASSEPALRALEAHPWLVSWTGAYWLLCLVIWGCAVVFARRPARLVPALAALCGVGILIEALTVAKGDIPEFLVHGGVVAAGWILGLLVARGADRQRAELFAWRGAIGALAATYVKAGIAKLSVAGLDWVNPDTLRGIVLAHYDPMGPGARIWMQDLILESPQIAQGLLAAGLAVEVGAVALLASGWLRTLACMGLIAFHVGVFAVTTNILFFSAFMFLFVVGWRVHPLERLAIRWLGSEAPLETSESAEQEPSVSSRPLVVAAFVGGLAVLVVWLTPLTVLQGARGDGVRRTVALESDTPVVQLHRRLEPGSLAQGWRLRHRSQLRDGAFSIWLQPPGEQRDAVPVILADPRVPVPSCEQEGQTAEGVRVCVTEVDTPLEELLPLLRP